MKKLILLFLLLLTSLPVFAFKEGDVLLYPSIGFGGILVNMESDRETEKAVGLEGNLAINGEFFIIDELSIFAGIGRESKASYGSIWATSSSSTSSDSYDITITEAFLMIPVILRYHVPLSDDLTLFFGPGFQYNKCLSSEYELSYYSYSGSYSGSDVDADGKFKKTDEKIGIVEIGMLAEEEGLVFGGGLRVFYVWKDKELSTPAALAKIEVGNSMGGTINGYIGIKF